MSYAVKEVFATIQGEGLRSGTAAVFLRFAGCNLWDGHPDHRTTGTGPCALWCDTDFFRGRRMEAAAIAVELEAAWTGRAAGPKWCVITGGEPALQLDPALLEALHGAGWSVALETNGTVENPAVALCDHVCVAPKRGTDWSARGAHEVKVVLPGAIPALNGWREEELEKIEHDYPDVVLFAQPQDGIDGAIARCVALVQRRSRWRLSLQTHKLLGLP